VKRILVSNDDGVHAPGLHALAQAMAPLGDVTVVAPLTEQSAASHALTIHHPLRVREVGPKVLAVDGTPTDCVLLAVREFLDELPDLVVSGINQGGNMGEDVIYSGTVAAAMEGALLGIPAVAFSLASRESRDFGPAADMAARLVRALLGKSLPPRFLLNVNIPALPEDRIQGFRAAKLGSRVYEDDIVRKTDPRGRDYFWIGGADPVWSKSPDSDFQAVQDGFASITPLRLDHTAEEGYGVLAGLDLERS